MEKRSNKKTSQTTNGRDYSQKEKEDGDGESGFSYNSNPDESTTRQTNTITPVKNEEGPTREDDDIRARPAKSVAEDDVDDASNAAQNSTNVESILFEHFRKVGAGSNVKAETAAEVHRLLLERKGERVGNSSR